MSMKNSNDTIGNRSRDLPACSAVPQPTAPAAACPLLPAVGSLLFLYGSTVYTTASLYPKFALNKRLKNPDC